MTTTTSQQDQLHGEDTVAQMAILIDRFSRMLSIMPGADSSPLDADDRADERALLIGVGLFAVADQLQRIGDLLAARPELTIPTGDEIEIQ